jgi:hypothetical protein
MRIQHRKNPYLQDLRRKGKKMNLPCIDGARGSEYVS